MQIKIYWEIIRNLTLNKYPVEKLGDKKFEKKKLIINSGFFKKNFKSNCLGTPS